MDDTLESVKIADQKHNPGDPPDGYPPGGYSPGGYSPDDLDLTALDRSLQNLYRTRALIGTPPPCPATARGRQGAHLVRLVRRALFWLWPQLDGFHAAMIEFAENQAALMKELREQLIDIDYEFGVLRQDRARGENSEPSADVAANPEGELWLKLVKCQARIEAVRQGAHLHEGEKAPDHRI